MFDPAEVPTGVLYPVQRVVDALLGAVPEIDTSEVMLVGAVCRDAMHAALGHEFATRATRDLDLALALRSWAAYQAITAAFPRVTDTGICFRIAGLDVDLLPFGDVEDPTGTVEPPSRGETLSVWAFEEIYGAALSIGLPNGRTIQIPTVPGYAAAKLGAWLDRSSHGEFKDATDLALVLYWCGESAALADRLYETPTEQAILQDESFDLARASARLLGTDVVTVIGADRQSELLARWPGNRVTLTRELRTSLGAGPSRWPGADRSLELIDALSRGLAHSLSGGSRAT